MTDLDTMEQDLTDSDPRTCPGCRSTRLVDLDGRFYCDTIDCRWAAGDRAARVAAAVDGGAGEC
jgi:hypothetical protein